MKKNGTILLVEEDAATGSQLCDVLNDLRVPNPVVYFSDTQEATQYLIQNHEDVFVVLQNAASPGLYLPESRNMVYMHEKFNVPEVAYMFLIHPTKANDAQNHTFVHCYYRLTADSNLKQLFTDIVKYWKEHLFPARQVQQKQQEL
jgi:hypothetical protein